MRDVQPWKHSTDIIKKIITMYLYGASGHAKVIIDLLEECGIKIEGLIDDNKKLSCVNGYNVIHEFHDNAPLIISIGSNRIRKILACKLQSIYGTAIHPKAIVSKRAKIQEGTVVMAGSIIQSDSAIGRHCIINTGASVDHECIIEDYVHLSPHTTLCGNVHIGEGSWIGAGSTVIQGINIGKWCVIGAGSIVSKDIPDGTLYVGNRQNILRHCYQNIIDEMNSIDNPVKTKSDITMLNSLKRGGVKA